MCPLKHRFKDRSKASRSCLKANNRHHAKAIVLIATHQTQDPVYKLLITDHGLTFEGNIDAVCLSGGVADCIRKTTDEDFPYGDIGVKLGQSIHEILGESDLVVEKAIETIRATVVGGQVPIPQMSAEALYVLMHLSSLLKIFQL